MEANHTYNLSNPMIAELLMDRFKHISLQDLNTLRQVSSTYYSKLNKTYWDRQDLTFQCMDNKFLNQYMSYGGHHSKKNWNFHNIYRKYNTSNLEYALQIYDWTEIRRQVEFIAPHIVHLQVNLLEFASNDKYQLTLPLPSFTSVKKLTVEFCRIEVVHKTHLEIFHQLYEELKNNIQTLEIICNDHRVDVNGILKFVAENTHLNSVELTFATNIRPFQLQEMDLEKLTQSLQRPLEIKLGLTVLSSHATDPDFIEYLEKYAPNILSLSVVKTSFLPHNPPFDLTRYKWTILESLELHFWNSALTLNCFPKLKKLGLRSIKWDECEITCLNEVENNEYELKVLGNLKKVFTNNLTLQKLTIENYSYELMNLPNEVKVYLETMYDVKFISMQIKRV